MSSLSYSQISFGVSPGLGLNSAYLGYKLNTKIVPFVGLQYISGKMNQSQSGQEFDYDINQVVSYTDDFSVSGRLIVPNIGVKYFLKSETKVRAYLSLTLSKPMISGKLSFDGEEEPEFSESIKSVSIWGGELGFGAEYFFDENFSIGGEFGIRHLTGSFEDTYDSDFYNPNTGNYQATEITQSFKLGLTPTFTRVSLNFYF